MSLYTDFGDRLEHLIQEKGVKKLDIANLLNIPKQTFNGYFGERIPKAETLIELSNYFTVDTFSSFP